MSDVSVWKCASCGELLEAQFDVCWKCGTAKPGFKAASPSQVSQLNHASDGATVPEPSDLIEELSKPIEPQTGPSTFFILLLIAGVVLFALGLVRFNSIESQILRAGRDGRDALGIILLFVGGSLATVGSLGVFGGSRPTVRQPEDFPDRSGHLDANAETVNLLERLALLKEKGALTDEEFQRQKQDILSR